MAFQTSLAKAGVTGGALCLLECTWDSAVRKSLFPDLAGGLSLVSKDTCGLFCRSHLERCQTSPSPHFHGRKRGDVQLCPRCTPPRRAETDAHTAVGCGVHPSSSSLTDVLRVCVLGRRRSRCTRIHLGEKRLKRCVQRAWRKGFKFDDNHHPRF